MDDWELEAREAIRHTIASYTYHADGGRFEHVAALFALDGVLEVQGIGGAHAQGRDEIRRFFGGVGDAVATSPPGRMQHHVANVWIEVLSEETARAVCYFTVMTGAGVDHWGRYRDTFEPEGDRWVFSHRLVHTDGVTPDGWAAARRAQE